MRNFAFATVLVLFAVGLVTAQETSGKDRKSLGVGVWVLDLANSNFGKVPPPKSATLHVTHCSAQKVAYTYSEVGSDGSKYEDSWSGKPDGQMRPAKTVPPSRTKASFEWQGDELIAKFDMGTEGKAEERITISEDGQRMTVTRTQQTPQGEIVITEVLKRVEKPGAATANP